ncbi:MAG: 5-methylcytosine-specific restriction protein A [Natronomonas sp.]|jgi:5-methylcytosine-specific restriction protein A
MPTECALCRRRVPDEHLGDPQAVQEHHLRPERRAESPTVMLCRPCHKQVHALFTNEELREDYDTIERLRGADRLQDYRSWIRGTDKLDIRVSTSDHVRERQ